MRWAWPDRSDAPLLFHFGDADAYIPTEKQRAVREAFAHHPGAEFHVHEGAGHAFDNQNSLVMHHERAALDAWAPDRRLSEPDAAGLAAPVRPGLYPRTT